jgi:hypothetical protein
MGTIVKRTAGGQLKKSRCVIEQLLNYMNGIERCFLHLKYMRKRNLMFSMIHLEED